MAAYPQNYWKLSTVKTICKRADQRGSATERKAGSGRPKSSRLDTNIARVEEFICSQEGQSGQHLSTREIAAKLDISDRSVCRIAKKDLCIIVLYYIFVRAFLNAPKSLGELPATPVMRES